MYISMYLVHSNDRYNSDLILESYDVDQFRKVNWNKLPYPGHWTRFKLVAVSSCHRKREIGIGHVWATSTND